MAISRFASLLYTSSSSHPLIQIEVFCEAVPKTAQVRSNSTYPYHSSYYSEELFGPLCFELLRRLLVSQKHQSLHDPNWGSDRHWQRRPINLGQAIPR
jgi:hypothetical protein